MKLGYIFREGIVGIRRSRMPFMISVFSVSIALVIVGLGVLAVDNGLQYIGEFQADYDLEIFLENEVALSEKRALGDIIKNYPGIIRMDYLSKEDAAALYNAEFGEDVLSLLDDNPLPSSIRVTFDDNHRNAEYISSFVQSIEVLDGVDEVIFKKNLFNRIQGIMRLVYVVATAALFLIILSTVFLTANSLRLMILARYEFIETVRLLGATDFMVKAPFFLEGGIIGFMGASLAVLIIVGFEYALKIYVHVDLPIRILDYPEVVLGLLIFGVSVSSLGVLKAVRKMLRYVA